MIIDVLIPTCTGREDTLAKTLASYEVSTNELRFHIVHDAETVGIGWNNAANSVEEPGDFIQLGCDDYLWHPGWDEAAIQCVQDGAMPSPLMLHPDGTTRFAGRHTMAGNRRVMCSSVPFLSWEWWRLIGGRTIDLHYESDNWVSWALDFHGIPTTYCPGYALTEQQNRTGGWRKRQSEGDRRRQDNAAAKELWSEWVSAQVAYNTG